MRNFWVLSLALLGTFVYGAEPTGRYKNVLDRMSLLQKQFPAVSSIFSIGKNGDGVELYAIRVSTTPEKMDPAKIGQILVSTHHGNELAAPEFTLAFIADLLQRYSSDELWRSKLHDQEFTIIPVLNISGYNANSREEHGIDPNRDYAGPCNSGAGGKLGSIKRLIDFYQTRIFAGSVTVHGYVGSITFPWGVHTTNFHSHDHNRYEQMFSNAAKFNGYRYGTSSDIVYPANGCYEDWVYWKYGSWSLLLELKNGSASDIQNTVPAIAAFYDQLDSTPSVKNQMTGSCNDYDGPDLRLE
jgi:hypothetical protein